MQSQRISFTEKRPRREQVSQKGRGAGRAVRRTSVVGDGHVGRRARPKLAVLLHLQ